MENKKALSVIASFMDSDDLIEIIMPDSITN